jgi:hypothetical protein
VDHDQRVLEVCVGHLRHQGLGRHHEEVEPQPSWQQTSIQAKQST